MSTAVLISGQMRTVKACAASIKSAFPDADFYIWAVADHDAQDAEVLDPLRLVIEPQGEMPERREYTWQLGRDCHGVQRVLKQLHGLKRVWEDMSALNICMIGSFAVDLICISTARLNMKINVAARL